MSLATTQISGDADTTPFTLDLVAASRRTLAFLRLVSHSHWLNRQPALLEAARRYHQLWMPLMSDLNRGPNPPMILPPLDVEWVWFCHTLNPVHYRNYCESRFSNIIGRPWIFDEENEEYAIDRCREIWESRFPSEPFENSIETTVSESEESEISTVIEPCDCEALLSAVSKWGNICRGWFTEPYCWEKVYLVAAKHRYKALIFLVRKFGDTGCSCLVPTSDVLLLWLTHKSYPTVYRADVKDLENNMERIMSVGDMAKEEDVEKTKMLWERTFDQPYEKAGGTPVSRLVADEPPFYWDIMDNDVNMRYKSVVPRFLLEVCVSVKAISNVQEVKRDPSRECLRLRMVKCHRELKMDSPVSLFTSESWRKVWHLYSEFGTKGVMIELRSRGGLFSKGSSLIDCVVFQWNEILRAPSLTLEKHIGERFRVIALITPPAQGPYLLKCVPDRVTDDSGAMISDVILKMNHYRPQEGRWLSRTVLDHAGRECFVTRMRVGEGFWRRGDEVPRAVKWGDRLIEIREGSWSYVAGSTSIGHSSVQGMWLELQCQRNHRKGFAPRGAFQPGMSC